MSKENFTPQIEMEQVNRDAQKARYTAYMERIRKLEMKVKADKEDGGTAV